MLSLAAPPSPGHRAIAVWLLITAALVFAMTVIGAITRLTESGLSMVEWRPLVGTLPPLSEDEWLRVFELYRQTPEYLYLNAGMSLAEFQRIFFWEWLHRLWGRLIGLVFLVPFLWFWLSGRLDRPLFWRLLGLLLLGGLQGLLGWFMVMSGLVDRPSVSHYRLAAHLGLALVIYSLLIWQALALLRPRPDGVETAPTGALAVPAGHARAALGLVGVTILWGAFVAGLDAGLAYNSFPLMDGAFLPPEAWALSPAWLNFVENTALVQFTHRWLGIAAALVVLALWWRVLVCEALAEGTRRLANGLAAMVLLQVILGVATLLAGVPVWLGALHQAGAVLVLTLLLGLCYALALPRPRTALYGAPLPA